MAVESLSSTGWLRAEQVFMKILLAHNFYRSSAPSGEDAVYRNERALLERHAEVVAYERHNDDIDESTLARKARLALNGAWSDRAYREVAALVRRERPDVAHFHNTFPLISPSVYAACRDQGVPVVQTLHNYRFVCPNALLLRDGQPCEDCLRGSLLPALRHRCYRGSLPATLAQVWAITSNRWRSTYRRNVDCYVALTRFAAGKLIAGGLPADRFVVKPNFLPDPPAAGRGEGGYAIFVGRLSEEKGVATLLEAWKQLPEWPLRVVGDGPLRPVLEARAKGWGLPVTFLGFRTRSEILDIVGNAEALVVPSEWYEGFPMVVLEAYACGTPVLASRIGSLTEIVREGQTGATFRPSDPADLAATVRRVLGDAGLLRRMRELAREEFLKKYTEGANISQSMQIYSEAIRQVARGGT